MKKHPKGYSEINYNGERIVNLYKTVILVEKNGVITLNSGGWKTNHTKKCMNLSLPYGVSVYQKKGEWYVNLFDKEIKFEDNMTIDLSGKK